VDLGLFVEWSGELLGVVLGGNKGTWFIESYSVLLVVVSYQYHAIWSPIIIDSPKAAAAYAILSVQPLTAYFVTLHPQAHRKRPPKHKTLHTRHNDTNRIHRCIPRPPSGKLQITWFFSHRFKLAARLQPSSV
jgi:hypothetical protein